MGTPCDAGFILMELPEATLSLSDEIPFSRSVWFISPDTELLRVILLVSLILGTGRPADLLLILESMLLVLERLPVPLRDLLGRGKLRYWRFVLALSCKYPSSLCDPSTLALRLEDLPMSPEDFGIFPRVAEPLVMVAPLVVMIGMPTTVLPGFLNPKVLVLAGIVLEELLRDFLVSSPLLRPASDGERFTWADFGDSLPFSDTFASSVFPVKIIG